MNDDSSVSFSFEFINDCKELFSNPLYEIRIASMIYIDLYIHNKMCD